MRRAPDYPKLRNGHQLLVHEDRLVYLLGGHCWGYADSNPRGNFVFDMDTGEWADAAHVSVPIRFAAATCAIGPAAHLLFGGLDEAREPTNELLHVNLATGQTHEVATTGSVPPPQFKGGLHHDAARGNLVLFDGYFTDRGGQKVHLCSTRTYVWRDVCTSVPLVRFQLCPVYGGSTIAVIGGMARSGEQRRTRGVRLFSLDDLKWRTAVGTLGRRFKPRTAQTAVEIPREHRAAFGMAELFLFGGSVELNGEPNNRGLPCGDVHYVRPQSLSLKALAAMALHRMNMFGVVRAVDDETDGDALLDELF
jgi:hypothetical protein